MEYFLYGMLAGIVITITSLILISHWLSLPTKKKGEDLNQWGP